MDSFHYFRLAYYPYILPHLIQYYSQDYAQLTGVIRATPQPRSSSTMEHKTTREYISNCSQGTRKAGAAK